MNRPGRAYVLVVIAILIFSAVLRILLTYLEDSDESLLSGVIRLFSQIALSYLLYIGVNWARILTAILALIGGIVSILSGFALIWLSGNLLIFPLLLIGIFHIMCFVILLFVPEVKAYFQQAAEDSA